MKKLLRSQSGFTFVESLITFSITGIFLTLIWASINFLLLKTNEQILRTRAHFFASEGIEVIKQIRKTETNRNRETGFGTAVGNRNGDYTISKVGDGFKLENGANEVIEATEEPYIDYCRTISIEGDNNNSKTIYSTVTWGGTECSENDKTIMYSVFLADIK